MKILLPIALLALLLLGCIKKTTTPPSAKPTPETLAENFDESAMNTAIDTARSRVDEFIKVLGENSANSFAVKVPIKEGEYTEHFWLSNVSFADGVFTGKIDNDPGVVKNVSYGQQWEVKKEEISDWMYIINERIHGGFTIDPLLDSLPREEADAMRAKLVR